MVPQFTAVVITCAVMEVKGKEGRTKMVVHVERVFFSIIKEAGEENMRIIAMRRLACSSSKIIKQCVVIKIISVVGLPTS